MDSHKHISFRREWELTLDSSYMLGQCDALVQAIADIPLKPEDRDRLLNVSLIKGAQATTAIEGNTLSEEEIKKIQEGWRLPPSKEYLEIEVKNILDGFNTLHKELIDRNFVRIINSAVIKEFHEMIGKNLGNHFDAIPGRFRTDTRSVGGYVAPDCKYVPELVENLCRWINKEFHFNEGQNFTTSVIQAIITHVYIEWIHPFGDGNGRTGRLLEFYILLRAGLPSIVSHILSNFYNETRPEYYRQLDNGRRKRDLTEFIEYAVRGFRDGLTENLEVIQRSQFTIFWHNYIYETFAEVKYTKREAFKRKRTLALQFPIERNFDLDKIISISSDISKMYVKLNKATLLRDLKELQDLKLIKKVGNKYSANTDLMKSMLPTKRK
ncbi:MAG: Fic family protein [Nitrospirae bacterium]|nr:Fic family protein [Nitrospirota bacterium]